MTSTTAITKVILSFQDVENLLKLRRAGDPQFFHEWRSQLPELTEEEISILTHLSTRYLHYLEAGEVNEGTLNIILISPLLNALGLCDPPYRIKGESWVEVRMPIDSETGVINLEGRIDALTLQQQFWLVVIEGKRGGFNVLRAVPQALAYMAATPQPERPLFGLVTNGYDYLFVKLAFLKLAGENQRQFALSYNFTLLSDAENNLLQVARILKYLVGIDAIALGNGIRIIEGKSQI